MKDKKVLQWLYQNTKSQLISLLALIVGNAVFAVCGVLFALACRSVIDHAASSDQREVMLKGIGLLAVIIAQLILRILCRSLEVRIQGRLESSLKLRLFGGIIHKDYAKTTQYHSGELMNRLTGDISVVSEGITTLLPGLAGLLAKVICALAVLYLFDPLFTVIYACGGLLLFFAIGFFRNRLKNLHKLVQEKDGATRSFLQEILENLIVVKTFGIEAGMEGKAKEYLREHYRAKLKKNNVSILANSGVSFTFSLGYLYTLLWSASRLAAKTISFGTLTAILQLTSQVQTPITGLSGLIPTAYGILASAERIMELERLPDDWEVNRQEICEQTIYEQMDSLFFKKVCFGYDREEVLCEADLSIKKGEFVVVSGASGIGKSTLLKLMLGIFEPAGGMAGLMQYSGKRLQLDRHTRKLFAYVPQGNLLLSGTIRDNICLINPNAAQEEIMSAVQISCSAEFIKALPDGLNTVIGEKGKGLSEGQSQRLSIARALLCGAPILLLDEATSALDEETEKQLIHNIRYLTDKTCILISHKKAALMLCDKEIHMEKGIITITEGKKRYEPKRA